MRRLTSMLRGRHLAREIWRRPAMIVALTLVVTGCSSDDNTATATTAGAALVPDATALAPGECDPAQTLEAPKITTGGTTTLATLGIGDFDCGGVNGDGYISFSYNPVLIDGEDEIEVSVDEGVTAAISWTGDQPFTESASGRWTATLTAKSCSRLTIELARELAAEVASTPVGTPAGESATRTPTATYGADIRVGGADVDCPQRTIDPSDPSATDPDVTGQVPPDASDPPVATDGQRPDPATTTTD